MDNDYHLTLCFIADHRPERNTVYSYPHMEPCFKIQRRLTNTLQFLVESHQFRSLVCCEATQLPLIYRTTQGSDAPSVVGIDISL
jgi:hypothetical protein